jgi:hypothetical protein
MPATRMRAARFGASRALSTNLRRGPSTLIVRSSRALPPPTLFPEGAMSESAATPEGAPQDATNSHNQWHGSLRIWEDRLRRARVSAPFSGGRSPATPTDILAEIRPAAEALAADARRTGFGIFASRIERLARDADSMDSADHLIGAMREQIYRRERAAKRKIAVQSEDSPLGSLRSRTDQALARPDAVAWAKPSPLRIPEARQERPTLRKRSP